MQEPEAFQLLTLASARDGRTVSASVAKVWANDLAGVELGEAVEAATMHYRESAVWLMPAHVIANVRRIREQKAREERVARARRGIERAPMPPRPQNYLLMVAEAIEANRKGT